MPDEAYQYALPTQEERAALAALLADPCTGSDKTHNPEPAPRAHAASEAAPAGDSISGHARSQVEEGLRAPGRSPGSQHALLGNGQHALLSNGHASTDPATSAQQDMRAACNQPHEAAAGPHKAPLSNGLASMHAAARAQEPAGAARAEWHRDASGGGAGASPKGHGAGEPEAAGLQGGAEALPPAPPADQRMAGRELSAAGERYALSSQPTRAACWHGMVLFGWHPGLSFYIKTKKMHLCCQRIVF